MQIERDWEFKFAAARAALLVLVFAFTCPSRAAAQQVNYSAVTIENPNPQATALFGWGVGGVGDINADGVPDFAVAAPGQSRVFVYDGPDRSVLRTLTMPGNGPVAVAGAGDVNADGVPDIVVGVRFAPVSFVFSGADGSELLVLTNPDPNCCFGEGGSQIVAGVGDLNGDAVPDLLVGFPNQPVAGIGQIGQALAFSGRDGSVLFTVRYPGNLPFGVHFGSAVAGVADVNRDNVPDLLVGTFRAGQTFLFSGVDGSLLRTLDAPLGELFFGYSLDAVGDTNSDGISDFLVGAFGAGQAFVVSGADGSILLTLDNPNPQINTRFGYAVAGPGDVNGDGVPDLLVSASLQDVGGIPDAGQAFVLSGADGSLVATIDNPNPRVEALASPIVGGPLGSCLFCENFGTSVASVGDVNRDGVTDLLVGAMAQDVGGNIDQGQAFLFLSVVRPQDALLQLVGDVVALNLKQGISNSLDSKLEAALQALDDMNDNNNAAAINALQAFINSVEAQRGVHINEADADSLIAAAKAIIAQLSGP